MILISGSSGFLGSHLIKHLRKRKKKFKIIKTKNIIYKKENFFREIKCFIHLGFDFHKGKNSIYKKDLNLRIVKKIILLSNKFKFKIIFPSTSTYKYKKNKIISKNIFAYDAYSKSKINCEKELIRNYNKNKIDTIIFRIFNVYGVEQKKGWLIPDLINKIMNNSRKNIELDYYQNTRDFIFVDDVISAITKSINIKGLQILNIGTSISTSLLDVLKLLMIILRSTKKIILMKKKSKKNHTSEADIFLTRKILNWSPKIKIKSGLKKIVNYERNKIKN